MRWSLSELLRWEVRKEDEEKKEEERQRRREGGLRGRLRWMREWHAVHSPAHVMMPQRSRMGRVSGRRKWNDGMHQIEWVWESGVQWGGDVEKE